MPIRKAEARDRVNHLQVVVNGDERRRIQERARAAGLSVSAYLRASGLGRQLRRDPVLDHEQVLVLAKVNADQGRLGGLLKLWLVEKPDQAVPAMEVRRMLDRIAELQGKLDEAAGRL